MFASPGSYPDVLAHLAADRSIPREIPELLIVLLAHVQEVLTGNLVGVYLRGSLALGDFDPVTSDVDFFVVTEHELAARGFASLLAMHDQLATLPNRFARHLEGTYLSRAAVRHFHPGERFPTISRQERLIWCEHGSNWLLERWIVREQG